MANDGALYRLARHVDSDGTVVLRIARCARGFRGAMVPYAAQQDDVDYDDRSCWARG